jgi:hypothetical protein
LYFGISSLLHIENSTSIAYRKNQNTTCDTYTLAARIKYGDKKIQDQQLTAYDEKLLKKSIPAIRDLLHTKKEFGIHIQTLLQKCGV